MSDYSKKGEVNKHTEGDVQDVVAKQTVLLGGSDGTTARGSAGKLGEEAPGQDIHSTSPSLPSSFKELASSARPSMESSSRAWGQVSHRRLTDAESETAERQEDDWSELRKAALERAGGNLSSKVVLPGKESASDVRVLDYDKLTRTQRKMLVGRTLETEDQDALRFLTKVKARADKAGVQLPTVEVRFQDLNVVADVFVGSRGLPSVGNSIRNFVQELLVKFRILRSDRRKFTILDQISGTIHPNRICLMLGPPGSGKSTLLQALAGKLDSSDLKISGEMTYNGHTFKEFVPQRTSAYVNQYDEHMAELTVRETLDFSRRVQGAGNRTAELEELKRLEKEKGIEPDPEIHAYMKANTIEGKREGIETDYVLHILGLGVCADTLVGSQMIRGISGGQKKRVTTGEMIAGPKRTLFMDEISTGLDSSTTFQIVRSLRDFVHLGSATAIIALLQPAPEVFDLFDDIMLLSEGHILYHGPRLEVMAFFRSLGFDIPKRKGIPDFLQEVSGKKDQQQYWVSREPYRHIAVRDIAERFKSWKVGKSNAEHLAKPFPKENSHPASLVRTPYALKVVPELKALMRRELTLVQRTMFIYVMKTAQVAIMGIVCATLFLRTQLHPTSLNDGTKYAGITFFSLLIMLFNGIAEMSMTIERFPVYFKQRDNLFYTAMSYCSPATLLRIPYSLTEAVVWSVLVYFEVNLAPNAGRFFMFMLLLFLVHQWSVALFRMMGALCRNIVVANATGLMLMLGVFLMGGFVITKQSVQPWVIWLYWISPMQYAQRALLINEFTDARWQKQKYPGTGPYSMENLGNGILSQFGFPHEYWWCWLAVGVLVAYTILFNIILVWAHQHLGAPGGGQKAVVSEDQLLERQEAIHGDNAEHLVEQEERADTVITEDQMQEAQIAEGGSDTGPQAVAVDFEPASPAGNNTSTRSIAATQGSGSMKNGAGNSRRTGASRTSMGNISERGANKGSFRGSMRSLASGGSKRKRQATGEGLVLPFDPMTMTFSDLHYFVDLPPQQANSPNAVAGEGGKMELELLRGISGAFRPEKLTALMGVTGAGKTTLMDVLAGRKTGGRITGDIRLNGFPKEQDSFARVSGYVEQFDIHQPYTTVHEALQFSAHLRFTTATPSDTVEQFITEVMALVELDSLANALVGRPGQSGLSVEQRKRLTIAVELVANPSIVFMDEPTSGLDARAAAIVMRTVRNIVNTGRTIVCTIHQPSIDIFEAFDELVLLKRGGETIYCGSLGEHSSDLIKYFSAIKGVPPAKEGLNPATWMLEVSTPGAEQRTGVDFAEIYKGSDFARNYQQVIDKFSKPAEGAKAIHFDSAYAKSLWGQYVINLWRFNITYWRTTEYNSVRFLLTCIIGLVFGFIFWKLGGHVRTQLGIQNVLGALYASVIFLGIINSIVLQPIAAENRGVLYRERAAGLYAVFPWVAAMVTMEVVYCTVQSVIYCCVVYFACGFAREPAKFFWFLLFLWQLLLFFTLFGLTAVALTPNIKVAAVFSSNFYSLFNLFAGFIVPVPQMPGWWVWLAYVNPCYWTIYGLVASQVGDFTNELILGSGMPSTPKAFIAKQFGYHHNFLGQIAAIMFSWLIFLFAISYICFRYINHLKR